MPLRASLIYTDNPGAIPASYAIPPGLDLVLQSIVVRWNAAAAAGPFKPCLSVYSQEGRLMGRFFPSSDLAVGDTAVCTYAPFLRSDRSFAAGTVHGCRAYRDATLALTADTDIPIPLTVENFDTDGYHDNATLNSRLTVPADLAGYYIITGGAMLATDTQLSLMYLRRNGTEKIAVVYGGENNENTGLGGYSVATVYSLNAGDYIEGVVRMDVAGTLGFANVAPFVGMLLVGQ